MKLLSCTVTHNREHKGTEMGKQKEKGKAQGNPDRKHPTCKRQMAILTGTHAHNETQSGAQK